MQSHHGHLQGSPCTCRRLSSSVQRANNQLSRRLPAAPGSPDTHLLGLGGGGGPPGGAPGGTGPGGEGAGVGSGEGRGPGPGRPGVGCRARSRSWS